MNGIVQNSWSTYELTVMYVCLDVVWDFNMSFWLRSWLSMNNK